MLFFLTQHTHTLFGWQLCSDQQLARLTLIPSAIILNDTGHVHFDSSSSPISGREVTWHGSSATRTWSSTRLLWRRHCTAHSPFHLFLWMLCSHCKCPHTHIHTHTHTHTHTSSGLHQRHIIAHSLNPPLPSIPFFPFVLPLEPPPPSIFSLGYPTAAFAPGYRLPQCLSPAADNVRGT